MFDVFAQNKDPSLQVNPAGLPIISLGDLLTFLIRGFFFVAGIAALIWGLRGALSWITSGGGKEEVDAARDKIIAAITGVFIIIVVLSVIVALEQFVFNRQLCFGISCPATIPQLEITPLPGRETTPGTGSNTGRNTNSGQSTGGSAPTISKTQLPATGRGGR